MKTTLAIAILTLLTAACATTPPVPPPSPSAQFGTLSVDPRLGYTGASDPGSVRRFDAAMHDLVAGRTAMAKEKLQTASASHPPARLALAALAIDEGDLETAGRLLSALPDSPGWTSAAYYRARLLEVRGESEPALLAYRALSASPTAPSVTRDRIAGLETRLFEESYQQALAGSGDEAIRQLRRALEFRPDSSAARLLLAQRLLQKGDLALARMELDPLLRTAQGEEIAVQATLAEIDVGRKRFEEAISRYERVVERDPNPRYRTRLDEIKREFARSNMPPRYRTAETSPALTRAELATLIYWNINTVRFGRPPADTPIAIDIANVEGREEVIRAIAWGIWSVDPVTRRVDPGRVVTGQSAARALYRVLTLSGLPPCAASAIPDPERSDAAVAALRACGVDVANIRTAPDAPVSGKWAVAALDQIEKILGAKG
jgi:tetratricopeptide (TPR) repeat protein